MSRDSWVLGGLWLVEIGVKNFLSKRSPVRQVPIIACYEKTLLL